MSGHKDGALSSSQGAGGKSQAQAQVEVNEKTGSTSATGQTNGQQHSSQSEVTANEKGGLADAQSSGPGKKDVRIEPDKFKSTTILTRHHDFEQGKHHLKHRLVLGRKVEPIIKFQIHSMEVDKHPHNLVYIRDKVNLKFMEISSMFQCTQPKLFVYYILLLSS